MEGEGLIEASQVNVRAPEHPEDVEILGVIGDPGLQPLDGELVRGRRSLGLEQPDQQLRARFLAKGGLVGEGGGGKQPVGHHHVALQAIGERRVGIVLANQRNPAHGDTGAAAPGIEAGEQRVGVQSFRVQPERLTERLLRAAIVPRSKLVAPGTDQQARRATGLVRRTVERGDGQSAIAGGQLGVTNRLDDLQGRVIGQIDRPGHGDGITDIAVADVELDQPNPQGDRR